MGGTVCISNTYHTLCVLYLGISLLHLHSDYMKMQKECCRDIPGAGFLFQCTEHMLSVCFQLLGQSRLSNTPSHLLRGKKIVISSM